jgi:hypothetical protein
MTSDGVDFEADSPAAIGELLGAGCDSWRKRQCVDRDWCKSICTKNLRGNASKVRMRFLQRGGAWQGRSSFSILVSRVCRCVLLIVCSF